MLSRRLIQLLLLGLPAAAPAQDAPAALAVFGDDFLIARIEAPALDDPRQWLHRDPGTYVYAYVQGLGDGEVEQIEERVAAGGAGRMLWKRHLGARVVETYSTDDMRDVLRIEEVDSENGFRVVLEPGVPIPAGVRMGDRWDVEAELSAYRLEDGELAYTGRMDAVHRYEGAWRIRTPAGEFDAVLLHEAFTISVGPLSVDDERWIFLAEGIGLVAEIEALRASALIVFRMREDSAKVLVEYPAR